MKRQLHNYRVEQTMARLRARKLYDDPMTVATPATKGTLKSTPSSTKNAGATNLTATHDYPSLKAGSKAHPGDSKMGPKSPSESTLKSISNADTLLSQSIAKTADAASQSIAKAADAAEAQQKGIELKNQTQANKNANKYYSKTDARQTQRAMIKEHALKTSMTSKAVCTQMKQDPDMVLSESDRIQVLVETFVDEKRLFRESDGKWIEVSSWPKACVESGKVLTRDKTDM